MTVSNSTRKEKLKYNDIRDLILAKEIRKRNVGETLGFGFALNLETRGKGNDRNSNRGRSKSRIGIEVNLDQANKYNARTMGKQLTLGGNAKVLRRRMKIILVML